MWLSIILSVPQSQISELLLVVSGLNLNSRAFTGSGLRTGRLRLISFEFSYSSYGLRVHKHDYSYILDWYRKYLELRGWGEGLTLNAVSINNSLKSVMQSNVTRHFFIIIAASKVFSKHRQQNKLTCSLGQSARLLLKLKYG